MGCGISLSIRPAAWTSPAEVQWDREIRVPFAPEAPESGVGVTSFFRSCWYRRVIAVPPLGEGERWLLHFGAVDYECTVWVDGRAVGHHVGGYTPFTVDLTPLGRRGSSVEWSFAPRTTRRISRSRAGSRTGSSSRTRFGIREPAVSGRRSGRKLSRHAGSTRSAGRRISRAGKSGWKRGSRGSRRTVCACTSASSCASQVIADDTYAVMSGEVHRRIALSDPGIDDYRNELLWSPESPTLIEAELQLWAGRGELVDQVASYTALRSIAHAG